MVKIISLIIVFIITQISINAFDDNENLNRDSLLNIWNNTLLSDTARLNALSELTWAIYLYDSPDSAIKLAQIQYDFSSEKNLKQWKPSALLIMGRVLDRKGIYAKAIKKYQEAVSYYKESNEINNLGNFYNDMAIIHISMDQYDEAQNYFNEIINISTQTGDTNELDVYYNNLAILFKLKKDYNSALEYYDKSLKMKIQRNDKLGMGIIYNNLGSIYMDLEDYQLAYKNLIKSLEIRTLIGDKNRIITSINNLCEYCIKVKKWNDALSYGTSAVKMAKDLNLKDEMKIAYKQLYMVFKQLKNYNKALLMYEKYNLLNDSILTEDYSNRLLKINIKEEYEYQFKSDSLKKDFNNKVYQINHDKSKEISSLKYIIYSLILLIVLIILFNVIKQKRA